MDFGQRNLPGSSIEMTRYHRAILALGTAFWDAHLAENPEALSWLNGAGVKSVLDPKDRWQSNEMAKISALAKPQRAEGDKRRRVSNRAR
jgi:hypothetical protein